MSGKKNCFRKKGAKIEWFTGMYLVVLLVILLSVQTQIRVYMATGTYVEDALAASNLASAVADYREYGRSGRIIIDDPDEACRLYCEALKENLCLNDQWESRREGLLYGPVQVLKYQIYNVKDNDIMIYSYGSEGKSVKEMTDGLGHVYTPDGVLVESTSVYSKVKFDVKGIFGIQVTAVKERTADIVSNLTNGTGGT